MEDKKDDMSARVIEYPTVPNSASITEEINSAQRSPTNIPQPTDVQSGGQVVRNIVKKDPTDFEKAILKLQDNNETKAKPNGLGVPLT